MVQTRDVVINKSLKDQFIQCALKQRREKHALLTPGDKISARKRIDVLSWSKFGVQFNPDCSEFVQASGCFDEDEIGYSANMESDGDA